MDNLQLFFQVPVDIDAVLKALLLSGSQGATEMVVARHAFLLPAHSATTYSAFMEAANRPGWSLVFTRPIKTYSTIHSPLIAAQYIVYGEKTYRSGWFYLTEDFDFDVALMQGLIINKMEFLYWNDSDLDTYITIEGQAFAVERSLYERVLMPIMQEGFKTIERYAETLRWQARR